MTNSRVMQRAIQFVDDFQSFQRISNNFESKFTLVQMPAQKPVKKPVQKPVAYRQSSAKFF